MIDRLGGERGPEGGGIGTHARCDGPLRDRVLGQPARSGERELIRGEHRRARHVDEDPADRQIVSAELCDAVDGLLDRHLLQQRHQVHGGAR